MRGRPFHEWPLVAFTTLAITGAGLLMAPALRLLPADRGPAVARDLTATGSAAPPAASALFVAGLVLLGIGLIVSLAHLGRFTRAPLAVTGVGHSRLSAEIALAGFSLTAGCLALASGSAWFLVATGLGAAAFLMSLGLVYALPGQVTWRGGVAFTPLVLGLGMGALAASATAPSPTPSTAWWLLLVLGVDVAITAGRWTRVGRAVRPGARAAHPAACARWRLLLAGRLLLADIVPAAVLLAALAWPPFAPLSPIVALVTLIDGVLVDRLAFYLLAVQESIEGEIEAVERAL